jgi:RNA polymerase sigma-70 factor (ECF subfamily)
MIYLVFNDGLLGDRRLGPAAGALCEEAIRLARLLLRLFRPSRRSWA